MNYAEVFDAIPVPATLIDARGIVLDVNHAFLEHARLRGRQLRKADRVGCHVVDFVHDDLDRDSFRTCVDQVLRDGVGWDLTQALRDTAGRPRYVRIQARAIRRAGVVQGAVILREDVTTQVLHRQRTVLEQRLRQEVWRMRHPDDVERLLVAVREGLHRLGLSFRDCGVNLVDAAGTGVRFHSMTADGSWEEAQAETGAGVVLDIWRRGQLAYRQDLEAEDLYGEAHSVAALFRHPVRCIVDVPFSRGTLAVNSDRPRTFTEADLEILQEMARVLSEGFDRVADLDALRRSEERYRAVVSQIADAVLLVDLDSFEVLETNAACDALLGYDAGQLQGHSLFDVVDHEPADIEFHSRRIREQGEHIVGERRFRRRDGGLVDVDVRVSRIAYGGRRVGCGVIRDITERKRSERHRAGLQRLREAVWRMSSGQDLGVVVEAARESLATMGVVFDRFVVNLVRPVHPTLAETFAEEGPWRRFDGRASSGLAASWWQAGEPVYRPDLSRQDPYDEAAILEAGYGFPVLAVLDVPFSHGTVAVNSRCPEAFGDVDLACLQEVASVLSEGFRRTEDLARLDAHRQYLEVTLRSIAEGVIATDEAGKVQLVNAAAEGLMGWTQAEAQGRDLPEVFPLLDEATRQPVTSPVQRVLREGQVVSLGPQRLLVARDGGERLLADSAAPIRGDADRIIGVVIVFQDVSAQRQAERERERAARLESLGILAGGIAHDFNNILTGITGSLSLARLEAEEDERLTKLLGDAETAALRASRLTGQLLTFARGGTPVRRAIDVALTVREAADFALQGSNVAVDYALSPDLWPAHADPNQIGQVVQNLVINADQAMPGGGRLRIEAANVTLSDGDPGGALPPGPYVRLRVADEGTGIDPRVLDRIFEPYFTTKETGSGLGLATVYAIVTQHEGHIDVVSRQGRGSTFTVHLPAAAEAVQADASTASAAARGRGQRVLVMDDERELLGLLSRSLKRLGYEGEFTRDGAAAVHALKAAQARGESFDVAILDLTVPGGMGGVEALRELRARAPDLRAIVSSGYSSDPVLADHEGFGFQGVLPKPYRIDDLARVLAEVLA